MADELMALSRSVRPTAQRDTYGQGGVVADIEQQLCELFEKPASLFLPTGTLAQCAALKCHSVQTGKTGIAMHPTSHLLLHEHMAIEALWGLTAIPVGKADSVITTEEFRSSAPDNLAAIIIELPMREIGGALPDWQTLCDIRAWCDKHDVRMHLDGARIWQTTPYYGRSLGDITSLFDSVYVSFYKELGGIFGAGLVAGDSLIDDARVWARRAGGNPITQYPEVLAAQRGLASYLPRMPEFVSYTRALCDELSKAPLELLPAKPQAAMFHVKVNMDAATLTERLIRYADKTHVMPLPIPRAGDDKHCICEISIGDQAVRHAPVFWAGHVRACLTK